jgi:hypothetical protein
VRYVKSRIKNALNSKRFLKKVTVSSGVTEFSPSVAVKKELARIRPRLQYRSGAVRTWQAVARQELIKLLGDFPDRQGGVIGEQLLWEASDDIAFYQKQILLMHGSIKVPIYRAWPKKEANGKTLICLQGHTSGMHVSLGMDKTESLAENNAPDRALGTFALKQGFNVVCIEQESLGERSETRLRKRAPHPCFDASMHQILLGRTILGARVRDTLSFLAYEKSRQKGAPIGLMGNSLGGTVALFASAISDDPDFTIASCCISDFGESLFNIYHCADLYVPELARVFSMGDIIGLCAPKPLILCAGVTDPIFPVLGFAKARGEGCTIYAAAEASDSLRTVIGAGGHRLYLPETFSELGRLIHV